MIKESHKKMIIKARNEAIKSIKDFMTLLDINPEAYDFLKNIKMKLSSNMGDNKAEYNTTTNIISINYNDIVEFEERLNDGEDEKEIFLELSHAITHEMIHAIRTITIENGLVLVDPEREEEKEREKQQKHNIDQYYNLLDQIITKEFVKELHSYIPIKITMNSDNTYTVIAYNKRTNQFHEFRNQQFETKLGEDDSLYKIGLELNDPNLKHKSNETIRTFIPRDKEDKDELAIIEDPFAPPSYGADQYYHPYSKSHRIIESKELEGDDLEKLLDKKREYFSKRSEDAEGFEESITEAIAYIIMIAANKKTIDLMSIAKKINELEDRTDVRVAANLLSYAGIDFIKWFLTSTFEDSYDDKTEKLFKEKYDLILEKMNELYRETFKEKPDVVLLGRLENEANDTIDELFSSMKR